MGFSCSWTDAAAGGNPSVHGWVTSSQQMGDQNRRQLQCEAQEKTLSALMILNVQNALSTLYYHTAVRYQWVYDSTLSITPTARHGGAWPNPDLSKAPRGSGRNGCWSCVWPGLKASILWGSHMFSFHNKFEMFWYRATSTHNIYIYINWKPFKVCQSDCLGPIVADSENPYPLVI